MNSSAYEKQLFEQRNQAYGAFQARRNANRRNLSSFLLALLLLSGCIAYPLILRWWRSLSDDDASQLRVAHKRSLSYAQLSAPPPIEMEDPGVPEAIPPEKAPKQAKRKFVKPVVKPDEEVPDAEVLPTQQELARVNPETEDVDGEEGGLYEGLGDGEGLIVDTPVEIPEVEQPQPPPEPEPEPEPKLYVAVEKMPSFPGGQAALLAWVAQRLSYPEHARENAIEGTVVIRFVVEPDGSLTNFEVMRGVAGGCTEEALRILTKMPRWEPGQQGDLKVRVTVAVPVRFKLKDS